MRSGVTLSNTIDLALWVSWSVIFYWVTLSGWARNAVVDAAFWALPLIGICVATFQMVLLRRTKFTLEEGIEE